MKLKYFKLEHEGITYFMTKIKCRDLLHISYVARRGLDDEEGAVQRILNKRRIGSISVFVQEGGYFPTNFILNFLDSTNVMVNEKEQELIVSDSENIAQVLDGQHRIAGLTDACKKVANLKEVEYPVLITIGLDTSQSAKIFLSINTEQKQVPRSLIYDLYGVVDVPRHDVSIDRARDIAQILNDEEDSPYHNFIKFPGSPRFKGGVQLSSMVTSLKPLVKPQGEFEKYNLTSLEIQAKVLINYFKAFQYYYDNSWFSISVNPFLYAMGFSAAIDILYMHLLPQCFAARDYSKNKFIDLLKFDSRNLPRKDKASGKSGDMQKREIYNAILDVVDNNEDGGEDIKL